MPNFEDPYKNQAPECLWYPYDSDQGGLRQLNAERNGREDYWTIVKQNLEMNKIYERLRGKRVIEIGQGDNVDFRDFCVEHEALEYIGVDLFRLPASPPTVLGKTRIRYCRKDMLQFLAQEPSDSAVIASFLVFCDELIRCRECEKLGIQPDDIIRRTVMEIYRVLIPGEYFIDMSLGGRFKKYLLEAGFIQENFLLLRKMP